MGVLTVEREDDRYFVTIKNRTYASEHEIPIEAARRHYRAIRDGTPSAAQTLEDVTPHKEKAGSSDGS